MNTADKDYYKVLGVSKDASQADIKKAFRKIARDNHPDQHPGDKKAEERFKEASEANEVLGDPDKRKKYDEQRSLLGGIGGGFRFPNSGGQTGAPSMEDILRNVQSDGGLGDIFSSFLGGTGGSRRGSRNSRRGSDVEGAVTIDFMDAVNGTTVPVQMVSESACPACRGTGAKAGTVPRVCTACDGAGVKTSSAGGVFSLGETCEVCHGRGLVVDDPCQVCHGSGRAKSSKSMQVRIPAGVTDGQRIRIKGKGSPGENGGEPGDLYVQITVRPHGVFGRSGDSITLEVPVTFPEAALGAQIDVPTLDGPTVKLRLPAGTANGRTMRVRGKGAARKDGTKGDMLVTIRVEVPSTLSDDARAALEQYQAKANEPDPRAGLLGGDA